MPKVTTGGGEGDFKKSQKGKGLYRVVRGKTLSGEDYSLLTWRPSEFDAKFLRGMSIDPQVPTIGFVEAYYE